MLIILLNKKQNQLNDLFNLQLSFNCRCSFFISVYFPKRHPDQNKQRTLEVVFTNKDTEQENQMPDGHRNSNYSAGSAQQGPPIQACAAPARDAGLCPIGDGESRE